MADQSTGEALPELRIAHFSDTHLAHEAYPARASSGWNLRGEDMARAVNTVVKNIVAEDPPLVIHSGDVAEVPMPGIRYLLLIRALFATLASRRPDGSLRQVVVVAGNHDYPRTTRSGCYLDLYSGIPGVHIVTSGVEKITFEGPDVPAELDRCVVTAMPHETLRHLAEIGMPEPVPGMRNILVAHGVAEATELFRRSVGREYTIPASLMVDDWSYVALGHWHTQGPVTPPGVSKRNSRIWYAGSTESVDFGDCRAAVVDSRGWLSVHLDGDDNLTVTPRTHPTRRMVTLPTIDITDMDPDTASAALVAAVRAADPDGAVIRQRVVAANRDLWAMVPLGPARDAAAKALLYRVDPTFADVDAAETDGEVRDAAAALGAVGQMLAERAVQLVPEADRDAALALAMSLAGAAIGDPDLAADNDAADTADVTDASATVVDAVGEGAAGTAGEAADTAAAVPVDPPAAAEPDTAPPSKEDVMAAVLADLAEDGNVTFASAVNIDGATPEEDQ